MFQPKAGGLGTPVGASSMEHSLASGAARVKENLGAGRNLEVDREREGRRTGFEGRLRQHILEGSPTHRYTAPAGGACDRAG